MSEILSKKDLLLSSLKKYYNAESLNIIVPIILQKTTVSLRILDWLVTNYSKKYNIIFTHNDKPLNIYIDYKNQLKAYSKQLFDPFCRRERIEYPINLEQLNETNREYIKENYITTTVGQLNFFRWAINNGIIKYAFENYNNIEQDMINIINERTKQRKEHSNKKREELSKCATKMVNRHNIKIVMQF